MTVPGTNTGGRRQATRPAEREPLARYNLFRTADLDEAREQVARVFCPHHLAIAGERGRFRTVQNHIDTGLLSLSYIDYGADVEIEPGELETFYLIQIPLSGAASIMTGGRAFIADPRQASILNPNRYTAMRWWAGCRKLQVQVARSVLDGIAADYFGRDFDEPVTFDATMDLTRPEAAAWLRQVHALLRYVEHDGATDANAPRRDFYAAELLRGLIEVQANSHSHFGGPEHTGPLPRYVRTALDFIRANAGKPLTSAEIARAAGVAGRTLQYGFRRFVGATPIEILRRERLDRCRLAFALGRGEAAISDVARRWGFAHPGRFSQAYRQRFGELPSQSASRG
jgi:AraC-like DNA-binding protein